MSTPREHFPGGRAFSAASLLNPRGNKVAKGNASLSTSAPHLDSVTLLPSFGTQFHAYNRVMPEHAAKKRAASAPPEMSPKEPFVHLLSSESNMPEYGDIHMKSFEHSISSCPTISVEDQVTDDGSGVQRNPDQPHLNVNTSNEADAARASSSKSSLAEPTFVFTSAYDMENESDGVGFDYNNLLEKTHGVAHREAQPSKKLKTEHPSRADGDSQIAIHEGGGVIGHWLQDKKREGSKTTSRSAFVNLDGGLSSEEPIQLDDFNDGNALPEQSVVDLTKDDEVIELPSNSEDDKEVCYGKVDGAQAYAHTIPHPKDHAGVTNDGSMWKVLHCSVFREPLRHFVIHLRDPHAKTFATVDTRVARALAPLIDSKYLHLKIDARLDPRKRHPSDYIGKEVSEYWRLTLNLYGPKKHAQVIGKTLSQKNVWLATPYGLRYGTEIFNPHVADRAAISKAKWAHRAQTGTSFVVRTNEEIAQDISGIFNSLSNTDNMPEAEPDNRVVTPLLHHQKQALHFMASRERIGDCPAEANPLWRSKARADGRKTFYNVITGNEQPYPPAPVLGGILADQMGLGKTLEAVAFVCSTLDNAENWANAAAQVTAGDGSKLDNTKTTLLVCPKNVASEWQDQITMHLKKNALKTYFYHGTNRSQDREFLREQDIVITTYSIVANELRRGSRNNRRSIFTTTNWFRIILDEAHAIREQSTQQSKAICALHASRRWALTGTPVQNRLEDLGALIKFLRIKPFDEPSAFVQYIMTSFKLKDQGALPKLRLLVDSFTLRRLKDRIDLPERTEEIIQLNFSTDEAALHNWFTKDAGNKMRLMQNKKKHLTGRSYQNVLRSILCLRLVSVHGRELLHEDDIQMISGISSEQPIDLDHEEAEPTLTVRAAYEMLMLMDSANRQLCNKCGKTVKPKEFEEDKDAIFGTMLPCYDLICNDCIGEVKKEVKAQAEADRFQCPFCKTLQRVSFFELTQSGVEEAETEREEAKLNPRQAKILGRYKSPHTKTYALIDHLKANEAESKDQVMEPPIKSVVFTEWTSHIDLLEIALEDLVPEIGFVRFDGKMNVKQQKAALESFRTDPKVTVIIVSIRAGGVGLNLTAASRVYVMEPQWNPAAEAQAVDRVHRLGQKRPVRIVRFIMSQSIEETMQKLQGKKKRMAEISLNRNMNKAQASVENMEEFKDLFSRRL